MTPKEKAKELINKFDKAVNVHTNTPLKKCALIAVNEIIEAKTKILDKGDGWQLVESNIYWDEVKKEIENL